MADTKESEYVETSMAGSAMLSYGLSIPSCCIPASPKELMNVHHTEIVLSFNSRNSVCRVEHLLPKITSIQIVSIICTAVHTLSSSPVCILAEDTATQKRLFTGMTHFKDKAYLRVLLPNEIIHKPDIWFATPESSKFACKKWVPGITLENYTAGVIRNAKDATNVHYYLPRYDTKRNEFLPPLQCPSAIIQEQIHHDRHDEVALLPIPNTQYKGYRMNEKDMLLLHQRMKNTLEDPRPLWKLSTCVFKAVHAEEMPPSLTGESRPSPTWSAYAKIQLFYSK